MRPVGIADFVLPFRLAFDTDPLKSVIEFHAMPASEIVSQVDVAAYVPRKPFWPRRTVFLGAD
jgi:hypothetical protein